MVKVKKLWKEMAHWPPQSGAFAPCFDCVELILYRKKNRHSESVS